MKNEFDADARRIIGYFENEGYKLNSFISQTVNIYDIHEKPLNSYMEPFKAELVKNNIAVNIEFYLKHEREHKKRKIKSVSIRPESFRLENILKSEKYLAEIFTDLI